MQDSRGRFIAIVIVTLVLVYIVFPAKTKWPPMLEDAKVQLGRDLGGGASLTYRLLYPKDFKGNKDEVSDTVLKVLSHRINSSGLKEPRITVQDKERVMIELAGVDRDALVDYERLIGTVGKLELKKVATQEKHEQFNQDGIVPLNHEKYPATDHTRSESHPWIKDSVLVESAAVIEGPQLRNAFHQSEIGQGWTVHFELHDDASLAFDAAAKELYSRTPKGQLAIIVDGKIKSAPVVQAEAFRGQGQITGRFSEKEAQELAIVLKSGSLPVPIGKMDGAIPKEKEPEAKDFIGPTLGQDAIMRGLLASIATIASVALFMIIYYRALGVIAVITLALNLVFLIAIMSFFKAELTLPGIAGIALTVGMAVDANILIYERMREESAKGKSLAQAFEAGHDRAFVTIMDSNITTLLAALVLYWFGTGSVRGFAVTLSIGILTTLASVLICGKTFLEMIISRGSIKELRMMKVLANPNYQFVKWLRPAVFGSFLVIAGTMAVFVYRGQENFGIDFRGGSFIHMALQQPKDINDVRTRIRTIKDPSTGQNRYPGADILTVAEPGASLTDVVKVGKALSRQFHVRDGSSDTAQLATDLQKAFLNELSHYPFEEILPDNEIGKAERLRDPGPFDNTRTFEHGPAAAGLFIYLASPNPAEFKLEDVRTGVSNAVKDLVGKDSAGNPEFLLDVMKEAPPGLVKLRLLLSKQDCEAGAADKIQEIRDGKRNKETNVITGGLKQLANQPYFKLSSDPFLQTHQISPTVAAEFKNSSIKAMVISWILMIAYVAIRFSSWRFGVAAVIALIHDALVAIGTVSLLGWVIPKSWGLSFDMNMTFVAAILTIIGYSINDTIVIFDRIRENLSLMKKESFAEIINVSINQTLSRSILTSLTVWLTVVVLYLATMTSGGGIAEFSLPLIIGVIAGSYSTIYIAAPIVLWWYKGQKPQLA